jgi:putative ABC transport system permease protein
MNWAGIFQYLGTDAPTNGLVWGILALGVFITFRILDVADLSVDTLFTFTGMLSILFINNGVDPLVSILLSILIGAAVGFLNAALHVYLKIPSLLAGIIVMVALYTPNVLIGGQITVNEDKSTVFTILNQLFHNEIASDIVILAVFMTALLFLLYWFFGTELGLSIRATGKNIPMAKAQGINTHRCYNLGMMISGGLVGLSGALFSQMNHSIPNTAGRGAIVIGLTIIFLGEVVLSPKSFKVSLVSILVGGILYWIIMDFIISLLSGIPNSSAYKDLIKALLIVTVVSISVAKKKIQKKKNLKKNRLPLKTESVEGSPND